MKKRKQKGFTLVELVIVIAVIAILASVLIPTFSGVIRRANIASDTTIVRNINEEIALKYSDRTNVKTMCDALNVAEDVGFIIERLTPTTANADILWDSVSGFFLLVDNQNNEIKTLFKDASTKDITNENKHNYWKIINKVKANGDYSNEGYSIAIADNNYSGEITVSAGFDALNNTKISKVNYINETEKQKDVVIRTNSFDTFVVIDVSIGE